MKLYILNYLIILVFLTIIYYKRHDKYELGGVIILFMTYLYFYYYYYWPEKFNVTPTEDYNYKEKLLWLNLENVDPHNYRSKEWANDILVNSAPNILGLYVHETNIPKHKLSVLIQKFEILFKHSPNYIYFENEQANYVHKFLDTKDIKHIKYTFRRPANYF